MILEESNKLLEKYKKVEANLPGRSILRFECDYFFRAYVKSMLPESSLTEKLLDITISHDLQTTKYSHYFLAYSEAVFRAIFTPAILNKPVKKPSILEIGVRNGGGLMMFADHLKFYFGDTFEPSLYAIDIDPRCKKLEQYGINVDIIDEKLDADFRQYSSKMPDMNIIVDDASHNPGMIYEAWSAFFDHLSPSGVYVIEDIHFADYPCNIEVNSSQYSDFRSTMLNKILNECIFSREDVCGLTIMPRMLLINKKSSKNKLAGTTFYDDCCKNVGVETTNQNIHIFLSTATMMMDGSHSFLGSKCLDMTLASNKYTEGFVELTSGIYYNIISPLSLPWPRCDYFNIDKINMSGDKELDFNKKTSFGTKVLNDMDGETINE